jgi:hypothetical protein
MITTSGRATSGLKALDNWTYNRLMQRCWPPIAPPAALALQTGKQALPGRTSLEAILSQHGPLPQQTAILGVDSNSSPLLLDLADPSPGALLISGSVGNAKTRLLHAILASTILINRPGQVEMRIIARDPAQYDHFFPAAHCRQILSTDDPLAGEAIVDLLPAIGLPHPGLRRAQAVILAVDNLEALVTHLDKQAFASLCWLARHGSRLRVWLIATLAAERIEQVDELLLSAFRTYLIENPTSDNSPASPDQFWLPLEDQAIPFWICEPEY